MIINNFNIISITVLPQETNPPLIVYADAPVVAPDTGKLFKPVRRWDTKKFKSCRIPVIYYQVCFIPERGR